jgi:hypothetical protein
MTLNRPGNIVTTLMALLAGACLASTSVQAGGPLLIGGADGHTPIRYQNPAITIHIESGDLGSISNSDANALVNDAFGLWNNIDASTINLIADTTTLAVDINIDNFEDYLPSAAGGDYHDNDGLNPLVYDANGEIIDAYFGAGQSNNTIGVAASIVDDNYTFFKEGYAVINGKSLGLPDDIYRLLIAHEIAHFFGLDHTQTDINRLEDDFGVPAICTTEQENRYALMYPFICRESVSLHADDISAASALYPEGIINDQYGILQGRFVDADGNAILGANIWANNVTSGDSISVISDYLVQANGYYKLYLPPGDYTLHANSVNDNFFGASGIGPYASNTSDISFQPPHPIQQVDYHGTDENSNIAVISIAANSTTSITFSITGQFISGEAPAEAEEDSIADLFGSLSILEILLLFASLGGLRYCTAHNRSK